MKYAVCTLLSVLVLCTPCLGAGPAKPITFPLLENYTNPPRLEMFMNDAVSFVQSNPQSPAAPRLLFDVYMLASLAGKSDLAGACRLPLLINYGDSLYGKYLFKSFTDNAEYKKFLEGALTTRFPNMSKKGAGDFSAAVKRGAEKFGPKFLTGRFALKCMLVARQAGDAEFANKIAKKLRKDADDEDNKELDIHLLPKLATIERILKLNEMITEHGIPKIIEYYMRQLDNDQRGDPRIIRIAVHLDISAERFAKALEAIRTLRDSQLDPQILYWKGRCLLALDKRPEALKALAEAQKFDPKSPWRKTSAKLAACVEGYGANMLASADLLLACSKKFRAEAEVVELELLTTLGKSKTPYRAYFGLVSADETVEVVLYRKDTIIMAYRSAPEGVRMYSEGSKEIVLYPKFHMTPVATFGIARNLDGGFETSFGFYVAGSLKEGMAASQKAWDSPYLTTKAGLLEYLCAESQRAGRIPSGFVREGKTTVLKITYFDMDTPETSEAELHFGDANVLTGIQSNLFQVRNIRYGRKSAMKLAGPKWPDVKVRTAESTTAPFKATSDMIAPIMKLGQLFVADE